MDASPAHTAAVLAATRLPAIQARYAMLETGVGNITIDCYADPRPAPGGAPSGVVLASIVQSDPLTLDELGLRFEFTPGVEGLIVATGDATWGRIRARDGSWWADCTISDEAGDGDIQLDSTGLGVGAFVRLLSAVVQG